MDSVRETGLYPPIRPYANGMLDVGDGHCMYYEVSGTPGGLPVVFVHGGPGAGAVATQRRYFNPDKYCIVLFDQRGAGRSTPYASLENNTTDHLVADMECLRRHLDIDKWLVAGGSWGATLALVYGTRHAAQCLGFVLRGIFLGAKAEVDWFLHGMGTFFPEHHADFSAHVSTTDRKRQGRDLFAAYCERLFDDAPDRHLPAARAWARYESMCSTLLPHGTPETGPSFDHYALTLARIEAHYFKHDLFLAENELLDRLESVHALPAIIVQGRYDVVCPIKTAHKLHVAWPNSELMVVPDAGHSGMEPGIARALSRAADVMARELPIP